MDVQQKQKQKKSIHIKAKNFLHEWDQSSKKQRNEILDRFIAHFKGHIDENNIYELEQELGELTPLFFCRIMSSFQMNYTKIPLIQRHIECIIIYLKSQDAKQYISRFVHAGGIQLILQILENEKISNADVECLEIIQIAIKSNSKYKEIVCMNKGIELLLNMMTSQINASNHDFSYCLYDTLKQLCLRNDAYLAFIHRSVIDCILHNSQKYETVGTLLKVLQSTLSFDDDVNVMTIENTNVSNTQIFEASNNEISEREKSENQEIINDENIRQILQLLEHRNHQIIYESFVCVE